jgi:hypothetical protein
LSSDSSLPGNVANLAASKPGEALESEDKVKRLNARKHRHREASQTRLFKAGAKTARSRVRVVERGPAYTPKTAGVAERT